MRKIIFLVTCFIAVLSGCKSRPKESVPVKTELPVSKVTDTIKEGTVVNPGEGLKNKYSSLLID